LAKGVAFPGKRESLAGGARLSPVSRAFSLFASRENQWIDNIMSGANLRRFSNIAKS
jgi:hypothetical protein